jgi:hypothetical protein
MAVKKPIPVSNIPPVKQQALDLAKGFARIRVDAALTKFRFKSGGLLIFFSVLVFLAGESIEIGKHFRPEFPERAWFVAKALFVVGIAFAGKEVVESVLSIVKYFSKSTESSGGDSA